MDSYSPEKEICPVCGTSGTCSFHSSYDRCLIDFVGGKTICRTITVRRVICRCCRHTHAVLPDVVIPYGQYSLLFLLRVLCEYFQHGCTVAVLCGRFNITVTMLYRWKDLFLCHAVQWMQTLEKMSTPEHFLADLLEGYPFSEFFSAFHSRFHFSFLQHHFGCSYIS